MSLLKACTDTTPLSTWIAPSSLNKYRTQLYLNNSLAGKSVEFIPKAEGREVTWYACGPTVYDSAHLGHARTYVTFDIIRRVMSNYFGYNIMMCMNITDIDDKIIQRSQENKENFSQLARHWEALFWQDMLQLNVLLPNVITRVSEYIPEIVEFIKRIIDNGYGYVSQGSVYFDTKSFRAASQHVYGRMEPTSVNDVDRVLEGEGALGIISEKRCPLDFALWKKAKENEPSWASPWSEGRPGWHIECSTMATSILGFPLDIHSGGVDLRFPHHDNELAQSEACYDMPQWVNYFIHSGHLHIKGSKMSKSLKNFITIQEILKDTSPRAIRFLFLMHKWDSPMNFTLDGESMNEANEIDKGFINFFGSIQALQRQLNSNPSMITLEKQHWDKEDFDLKDSINACLNKVDAALRDNIDTPIVIRLLRSLMTSTNIYMKRDKPKLPLVIKAAQYIFRILVIFGVTNGNENSLNYFDEQSTATSETDLMECLTDFRSNVRSQMKDLTKSLKKMKVTDEESLKLKSQAAKAIDHVFELSDQMRNDSLKKIGFLIEDTKSTSTWRKLTKEELQEKSA